MTSPLIEKGSAALHHGDAATARRAFEAAVAEAESGAALEGLAEALYLEREYSASAAHYERAYSAYRREVDNMAAGRAARSVAWITGNVLGDWAVQNGWSRDEHVLPMFEFTTQLATLEPPPPELQQLLGAVHGNQEAMDGFARVNAGVTSPAEFFADENVGRIFAAAGERQAS